MGYQFHSVSFVGLVLHPPLIDFLMLLAFAILRGH